MDTDDDDEVEVPLANLMRKKARLDKPENTSPSEQTSVVVPTSAPAPASAPGPGPASDPTPIPVAPVAENVFDSQGAVAESDAMDEDEGEEEDDEIGPDGNRSVRYCLDAFTDEDDNGASVCRLCL